MPIGYGFDVCPGAVSPQFTSIARTWIGKLFTIFPPSDPDFMRRARGLANNVVRSRPGIPAYFSGSLLAGLGTPNSDVDLFAVTEQSTVTEQIFVDSVRCDVEYTTAARLERMVESCEKFTVTEDDPSQLRAASPAVLDQMVRFMYGEIVQDDEAQSLRRLHERARALAEPVGRLIIAHLAMRAANRVEDAFGALAVGDEDSAQHLARTNLLGAADALLTARGDAYRGDKWIWRRWRRSAGDAFGDHVEAMLRDPAVPARAAFWLAQDLFVHAMTQWSYPIAAAGPESGARREASVLPYPTDGPILLNLDDRAIRVSAQGAFLWGVAHGRSREDAVDHVARTLGTAASQVDAYYQRLLESGVLLAGDSPRQTDGG